MVTICLECGNEGFDDAYVHCSACLKFAVHRYCLPEITQIYDEFDNWICDNCKEVLSASLEALLNTQDGRCLESVISTSTSGSNKKSISQSSPGKDENHAINEPMLQSVPENLDSSGDTRSSDTCCPAGVEPTANTDWSQKKSVQMKREHRRDTSRQLNGVEEVKVAADELLQRTNLREKAEVSSSLSEKEKQRLPTTANQKIVDREHQSDTYRLDGEEEALGDRLSKRTRSRKNSGILSPVPEKEKQKHTKSPQINGVDATVNEVLSRDNKLVKEGEEKAEVEADRLSKRTRFEKNRGISSPVPEKEKQKHTNFPQIHGVKATVNEVLSRDNELVKEEEEKAEVAVDRLSQKTRFEKDIGISPPAPEKEKQKHTNSPQIHGVVETVNEVLSRDIEQVKEPLVIPTRSTVNEELSHYPIMPPPSAGPNVCPFQVKPVADPIWRGKFHIINKKDETFEGFVAHLSNMACQRVKEEARLLPALLKLESVPKSTVWPKSFQRTPPSDECIALYIFPSDRRYEKNFDSLIIEMSKKELALRGTSKNAELLIFHSTELQAITSWRFQSKYFIWGVFKGKV